jgi:phosphate-selective porin OprO/OprP
MIRYKQSAIVLFLMLTVSIGGWAQNKSDDAKLDQVIEKLSALEQRIAEIETRLNATNSDAAPAAALASTDIAAQLEALDQQIKISERRRELAQEELTARTAAAPIVTAGEGGFAIQNNNGDYRLNVGMVAQVDGRFSLDSPKPITNTFTIRKIRPTFQGRVAKFFDFKVMPDFGNGVTIIQDAYFDIRFSPKFRIRTGKDKTPIGYELLQGDAFLLFPERSLSSSLVPNRDIGIQAQGDLFANKVFYAAGVFNGIPDGTSTSNELDVNSSKDAAARLVVQPFRSTGPLPGPLSGLGAQIGGSVGRQFGALPAFRTSVGQTYFSYNASAAASGDRKRLSPAVFYYYKGFGAFGEYMRSTQSVNRSRITNEGWELTGSWVLTGEAASDRGVRPRDLFDPTEGRWGALQLVGRYANLSVDGEAFTAGLAASNASRRAKSFTVGANWYPAGFIKQYITYERTKFTGGAERPTENVILVRSQIAF